MAEGFGKGRQEPDLMRGVAWRLFGYLTSLGLSYLICNTGMVMIMRIH